MRIEYHRTLLADAGRNAALYDALKALIVPGQTVVADIGAGTGLLGLMAHKLGAREVFLYESEAVGAVAEEVLAANRARKCTVFPCSSLEMDDPPRADLIVSETLGNYAFEENMIETLNDAVLRHLKPGGTVLPSGVHQFVSPVIAPRLHDELTAWDRVGFELDFSTARVMSLNNVYVRSLSAVELLAPRGAVWDAVDFSAGAKGLNTSARKGDAVFDVPAGATVFGLAYWWEAALGGHGVLSTAPDGPPSHWEQLYFPMLEPMAFETSGRVKASLKSTSSFEAGTHLAWQVARVNAQGGVIARQKMDLDRGYLP